MELLWQSVNNDQKKRQKKTIGWMVLEALFIERREWS